MKKAVFWILLIFCSLSYAQESPQMEFPEIMPPAPTAHELGKYGQVPVGTFTGIPDVNVPLYIYKTQNLSVPISLNYNSNGILVDQVSSNVGLGWNLNTGGVISRVVRGKPDERKTSQITEEIANNPSSDAAIHYFYNVSETDSDSQPDIYTYNFVGYTGKFILDENGLPVSVPHNNLKIQKYYDVSYGFAFSITTPDGVEYQFLEPEHSTRRISGPGTNHTPPDINGITAWYLTKIIHPKGDVIEFLYNSANYQYVQSQQQSLTVMTPKQQTGCSGLVSKPCEIAPVSSINMNVSGKHLVQIKSNRTSAGTINYTYDYTHPGITGYKIVSSITLKDAASNIRETFTFNYLFTNNKRVFLSKIVFKDSDKFYRMEYEDPEGLASRLSFSQDEWGYYNSKSNSFLFPNPKSVENIPIGGESAFSSCNTSGADKTADLSYTKKGILKRIHYPAKGYSEFIYEPNTIWTKVTSPPPIKSININGDTGQGQSNVEKTIMIDEVKMSQTVKIRGSMSFNDNTCPESMNISRYSATISIQNLTDPNQTNIFYEGSEGSSVNFNGSTIYMTITSPETSYVSVSGVYANLRANNVYELKIKTDRACTAASAGLSYYAGSSTEEETNKVSGGLRIREIIDHDPVTNTKNIKHYYYGKKESLDMSSGIEGIPAYYISNRTVRMNCSPGYSEITYRTLHSSSIYPLSYSLGNHSTYYQTVTISHGGENFENGGEEHEHIIHNDIPANTIYGDHIPSAPWTNTGWNNGLKKRISIFKKENNAFTILNEKINDYRTDSRYKKTIYGYLIRKNYDLIVKYPQPDIRNIANLDIAQYDTYSYWYYLASERQIQYDALGKNPVTSTINHYYDNPSHLLPTREEVMGSNGKLLKKRTYYSQDLSNPSSVEQKLITQHRIAEPILVETYQDGTKLSAQRDVFGDTWGNNQVLLKEIRTSKGTASLIPRIQYHKYDSYGTPLELSMVNGPHITYLWGYNGQYPVAKIENATYAEVTATGVNLPVLQSISSTEAARITELNKIRNHTTMTNTQVTTYTYKPLIGVSTITNPRGEKTTYTYDTFNRLQFIKDETSKLLEEYKYHYKN